MKFSVLISCYKNDDSKQLEEALKSIYVEQTVKPDQIVLVKDGHLSAELDICIENFKNIFPLHVVSLKKNVGLGMALNEGLKHCKHEWVARMDSDDISCPRRFENQVNFIKTNPRLSVVGGLIEEFDNQDNKITSIRTVPAHNKDIYSLLKWRNPMNHVSVFFKKEDVIQAGGYKSMIYFEDYYLWARMLRKNMLFHNLQNVLVKVRVGQDMISRRTGFNYIRREYKFYKQIRKEDIISALEFFKIIIIRIPIRLLPNFMTQLVYNFIRKK